MSSVDNIVGRMYEAAKIINLDEKLLVVLPTFKLKWECDLLTTMDNGEKRSFSAMRFWHRSPYTDMPHKGGIRFHPNINPDMMKAHAMEMSLKCWTLNVELGGAKGGIAVDPTKISDSERKRLTENFVEELHERNGIGPYYDVPAPDVGTNAEIMDLIRQAYGKQNRKYQNTSSAGVVTGKSPDYGGIPGRVPATGYGLARVLVKIMDLYGLGNAQSSSHNRVGIIGFGNVGCNVAKFLKRKGFNILAISDINGGVYCPDGIDTETLDRIKTPADVQGGIKISNEEMIELDVDVLIPAALENTFTGENAGKVKAKIILEGANGPTTPEADIIFAEKEKIIIPDTLANAGGVCVSYFEWGRNQNIIDERIPVAKYAPIVTEDEVLEASGKMMEYSAIEVYNFSQNNKINLRLATYAVGLQRIAPRLMRKYF